MPRLEAGARWMLGAALAFTLMAVCARQLSPQIPVFQMILVRSIFSIAVTSFLMRRNRVSWKPTQPGLLIARAVVGFLSLWCYFEAIARIPLGNAVVLLYLNPVVAGILAAVFLGEPYGRRQLAAGLLCLVGVALIAHPSPEAPLLGSLLGLSTGFLSGAAYTLVRAAHRKGEDHLRIVISFPLLSFPCAWLLLGGGWVPPHESEWGWLLLLGITTQVGQVCLTQGLRHETAARASQVGFLAPILGMLFGVALGDPWPGWAAMSGVLFILLGLVRHRPLPERSPRPVG